MKKIRLVDLVVWCCMAVLAGLMLISFFGCAGFDRAVTVAEEAVAIAKDAQTAGAEIREQVDDEDWLGVTESVLIGAGAVLSAFGVKKGYDKVKGNKQNGAGV